MTYKQNSPLEIYLVSNQSSLNISIYYPNGSMAIDNLAMTKNGFRYNFTFSKTNDQGIYSYNYCDPSGICESNYFQITGTGYEFNTARAIIYIGLLCVLTFMFITNVSVIPLLPSKNKKEDELISINQLKYLRAVLYVTAYLLFLALIYTSSNISFAYLGEQMFAKLLFNIFLVMAWILPLGVIIWLIYIFYMIFEDKEIKRMLDRGFGEDMGGSI